MISTQTVTVHRRAFSELKMPYDQWWQQILPICNTKHRQNPLLEREVRVNSNTLYNIA